MTILSVLLLVQIGSVVAAILTAVDASKYPEWAFRQSGSTKFVWQIVPIVFILVCGPAAGVMGLIWLTSKREVVARFAAGGPPYGALPPGWGSPPGSSPWVPPQPPQ